MAKLRGFPVGGFQNDPVPWYFVGTPGGGVFYDERRLEWFEVQGDSMHVVSAPAQRPFRAFRLMLATLPPKDIEHLEVRSIRFGLTEQLAVDRVPAQMFGMEAYGPTIQTTSAAPGDIVAITLRSYSPDAMKVALLLEGVCIK